MHNSNRSFRIAMIEALSLQGKSVGAPLAFDMSSGRMPDARIVVETMLFFACEGRLLNEAGASASGAPTNSADRAQGDPLSLTLTT